MLTVKPATSRGIKSAGSVVLVSNVPVCFTPSTVPVSNWAKLLSAAARWS